MVDSKKNTSAYYTTFICHFSEIVIIFKLLESTDKAESNTLSTSKTIKPRFVDTWVHDSSPLDIDLENVTSIILPPLIWLESETIPLKMTVRNIGTTCTNTILPILLAIT